MREVQPGDVHAGADQPPNRPTASAEAVAGPSVHTIRVRRPPAAGPALPGVNGSRQLGAT
ncbi:MAG TPA: hypothetical protein VHA57_03355 [Actinomycetota bacterium]|nr:hypothetical protein [Actinomycetota bacterium]